MSLWLSSANRVISRCMLRRCPQCRGQSSWLRHANDKPSQTDGKSRHLAVLPRREVDPQQPLRRSVHQPSAPESVNAPAQRSAVILRDDSDGRPGKTGSKRPTHSDLHLIANHLDVGTGRGQKQGARQDSVPVVEPDRETLWRAGAHGSKSNDMQRLVFRLKA